MKIFMFDKSKIERFLTARDKHVELDDRYTDAINFLPDYIGSIFPNAMSPNKAENVMRKLEPELSQAKSELIEALRDLIPHLAEYQTRLETGRQCF
jgi:hypothetical protein